MLFVCVYVCVKSTPVGSNQTLVANKQHNNSTMATITAQIAHKQHHSQASLQYR